MVGIAGCSGNPAETDGTTTADAPAEEETSSGEEAHLATPSFLAKFRANDGDREDNFGRSVALSGDTALVTAPQNDEPNGRDSGSAYVFQQGAGSWTRQAKLDADDGDAQDRFGNAAALSGDTALIGAATDEGRVGAEIGSAYVFERADGSWTQGAKLVADDGELYDNFGESVAIDGDTAIVGAPRHAANNGANAGAAYVFVRDGESWTQREKLAPRALDRADFFGRAVALDGATAIVGAPQEEEPNGAEAGAVYAFERTNGSWRMQDRIAPDDGRRGAHFGRAVALAGERAVVGAPDEGSNDPETGNPVEGTNGPRAGAAYVFERAGDSWIQRARLLPDDGDEGDRFGTSVALEGDVAMVGAPWDETPNGRDGGSAYVIQPVEGSWTQGAKIAARHGRPEENYGWSVDLSDGLALAGVPREDLAEGHSAGAAHCYELV